MCRRQGVLPTIPVNAAMGARMLLGVLWRNIITDELILISILNRANIKMSLTVNKIFHAIRPSLLLRSTAISHIDVCNFSEREDISFRRSVDKHVISLLRSVGNEENSLAAFVYKPWDSLHRFSCLSKCLQICKIFVELLHATYVWTWQAREVDVGVSRFFCGEFSSSAQILR